MDGLDGRRNDCLIIRIGFWDFVVHARPGEWRYGEWCSGDDVVVTGVAVQRIKVQRLYGVSDLV